MPEVRSRASSPERAINIDSARTATRVQGIPPPLNYSLENPNANSMAGVDIRLTILNGNGVEDPEKHWFLSEFFWMVPLVHNADLKKAQMITTLRVRALDWFMKFFLVPPKKPQNILEEI